MAFKDSGLKHGLGFRVSRAFGLCELDFFFFWGGGGLITLITLLYQGTLNLIPLCDPYIHK